MSDPFYGQHTNGTYLVRSSGILPRLGFESTTIYRGKMPFLRPDQDKASTIRQHSIFVLSTWKDCVDVYATNELIRAIQSRCSRLYYARVRCLGKFHSHH